MASLRTLIGGSRDGADPDGFARHHHFHAAIFLPSFLMILSILSLLQRMKDLQWLRAFMRGVAPAVIGALAVSLVQIAPHAAPDVFTWILMALTVGVILLRNVGPANRQLSVIVRSLNPRWRRR